MKKPKKLAGIAGVALLAVLAGAAPASAATSTICSAAESPCLPVNTWALGTEVNFSLPATGGTVEWQTTGKEPVKLNTCRASTLKGKLESDSTKGTNAEDFFSELRWENCTNAIETLRSGGVELEGTGGGNATVRAFSEITVTIKTTLFGNCTYTLSPNTTIATLTEGKPATLAVQAVAVKTNPSQAVCPTAVEWKGSYTLAQPANTTAYISII